MPIKITKMQGCGNDFVILEYEEFKKMNCEMSEAAKKLCDRNFGIGADGLIIPNTQTEDTDIGWFFYNSDGTTAQMCGNGMRCFAKYVYDKKLVDKNEFTVKTLAGIITPKILDNGQVQVNMSKPILESDKIPFTYKKYVRYFKEIINETLYFIQPAGGTWRIYRKTC
jgi:diaminopimelate epimerase